MQAKKSLEEKTKESDANKAKIQEVIDKAEPLTVIQWFIGGHSLMISEAKTWLLSFTHSKKKQKLQRKAECEKAFQFIA